MMELAKRALGFSFVSAAALAGQAPVKDFPDLVAKVSPSVVNIQATKILPNAHMAKYVSEAADKTGTALEGAQSSLGSGFVVLSTQKSQNVKSGVRDMLILTNDHVIAEADEIEIMIAGSRERFMAKIVAHDPRTDIAVLKATLPARIEPLPLGDSDKMRVGEGVFAIGNPFGLAHTVTTGILSAKNRSLGIGRADRYLQTDASINPGNSGGPLFNAKGEVVGINTMVRVDAQGIGFAIPSNTVVKLLPILERDGNWSQGWLGLVAANESTALQRKYKFNATDGVVITNLVKNGPAHKIELQPGDVISTIAVGKHVYPTASVSALRDALEGAAPGTEVELHVSRDGRQFLGRMKLEASPSEERLPGGYDYY